LKYCRSEVVHQENIELKIYPFQMLSKSRITKGLRCHKALWLQVHKPDLSVVSEATKSVFAIGTDVGILARDFFPGGELAVTGDRPDTGSVERTQELIRQGKKTIYEATFVYDNTLVAVDILTREDGAWKMVECKATTQVKPEHVMDVAVQYYVVTGAGIPLEDASVMHLNNRYIRRGALEVNRLFTCECVLKQVQEQQQLVRENIVSLLDMLGKEEPIRAIGKQCNSPYECDFQVYCKSLLPPLEVPAPDHTPAVRKEAIRKWLERYGYPLYYFDFETFMPAVPRFDESRPYQQIPFQYSLHYRESKGSEPEHTAYLAWPEGDPRKALIEQLIRDTLRPGKILVYHQAFEESRFRELARDFPEYRDALHAIISRLEDLMSPFRGKDWHTPSMGRGYSIKTVLPLMVPELSYHDLEIQDGGDASSRFAALYDTTDRQLIDQTREALLQYCHLDTLAMVRIVEELERIV
jgi:hypothetical protein